MLRQVIAKFSARLFRASIDRIADDLELAWKLRACFTSVSLIESSMHGAKPCSTRDEVMKVAINATADDGFICELGVYKGESINKLAKFFSSETVYGFDTFTGLPEFWRDGFPKGEFSTTFEELKFERNCTLYKGLFDETLPTFLEEENRSAKLIHIDCDLYSSTIIALKILAPRIRLGTILVFDEYFNYRGWPVYEHKAFQEFLTHSELSCRFIAYNKLGQQVAAVITK